MGSTQEVASLTKTPGNPLAGQAVIELRVPLLYSLGVHAERLSAIRWAELSAAKRQQEPSAARAVTVRTSR